MMNESEVMKGEGLLFDFYEFDRTQEMTMTTAQMHTKKNFHSSFGNI
jgi:hypothetical protein